MYNIFYLLFNKLNRLIIVIIFKCCWLICMLYIYKYNIFVYICIYLNIGYLYLVNEVCL